MRSSLPHRVVNTLSAVDASGVGQLLIRAGLGAVFVYHGAQKLFGWFGGYGIEGTSGFFAQIGIPLPLLSTYLAASTEFVGGLLLIAGLGTRLWGVALAFTMLVAIVTVHNSAFGAQHNGMEFPLTLGLASLALTFLGSGRLSLDALVVASLTAPRRNTVEVPSAARVASAV